MVLDFRLGLRQEKQNFGVAQSLDDSVLHRCDRAKAINIKIDFQP